MRLADPPLSCDPVDHGGAAVPAFPAPAMWGSRSATSSSWRCSGKTLWHEVGLGVAKCAADPLARLPEMTAAAGSMRALDDEMPDDLASALWSAVGGHYLEFAAECRRAADHRPTTARGGPIRRVRPTP